MHGIVELRKPPSHIRLPPTLDSGATRRRAREFRVPDSAVHGVVELVEEPVVFLLTAFGGEVQRIYFRRKSLRNETRKSFNEICPGITRRTIANGKTMYQMIATLAAGSFHRERQHARDFIERVRVRRVLPQEFNT